MSPWTVRLLAVLSCILPGPQFLAYIVLWILMPSRDESRDSHADRARAR